jgi:hypothetical protein
MIRSGSSPQATVLEATIVLETRLGDAGGREFDHWLLKVGAAVVLVDAEQSDAARRVWRRYGKGRHAAALNYVLLLCASARSWRAPAVQGRRPRQNRYQSTRRSNARIVRQRPSTAVLLRGCVGDARRQLVGWVAKPITLPTPRYRGSPKSPLFFATAFAPGKCWCLRCHYRAVTPVALAHLLVG